MEERNDIRFAIPSNGRLEKDTLEFMKACGLTVKRPNSRSYTATIPMLPDVSAIWQRQNDIVRGVRVGSLDFAVVGQDALEERCAGEPTCENIVIVHNALNISHCELHLAVPQAWDNVFTMADLARKAIEIEENTGRPLRIATKFPRLTERFLNQHNINHELFKADGTLEIAPALGYADMIADLVSTGNTLRANALRQLDDGRMIHSQGVLIASKQALQTRPEVRQVAYELLEYIEAYLRAQDCYTVVSNMRGESPQAIANRMLDKTHIRGLQGPTISQIVPHNGTIESNKNWYAVQIIVKKKNLSAAIRELRQIGGSGVIVTPVRYIFEEVPERYQALLAEIGL